ncbi:hypothetical protein ACFE04_006778 [Oxalis oulophora]
MTQSSSSSSSSSSVVVSIHVDKDNQQQQHTIITKANSVLFSGWLLYDPSAYYPLQISSFPDNTNNYDPNLEIILKNASMPDKTVILTTLNQAWAEPGSLLDLFLESFRMGNGTQRLLNHLVIVSLDQKAHDRCLTVHQHCYMLDTGTNSSDEEAYFMTPTYLEMMWRRIQFLTTVLSLGYNFVFTDTDIMWLQDPFPRFFLHADFQIACDHFYGNPYDNNNDPNGGFTYVKSNIRTVSFYKYWYASRRSYPGQHDQDVLNKIKRSLFISKIGLRMAYLDTKNFGGFCEHSNELKDVCTMHANCCFGLHSKIIDLTLVLEDWKNYSTTLGAYGNARPTLSWRAPQNCSFKILGSPLLPPAPSQRAKDPFSSSLRVPGSCGHKGHQRHRRRTKTSQGHL